jgi:hypothetical protein
MAVFILPADANINSAGFASKFGLDIIATKVAEQSLWKSMKIPSEVNSQRDSEILITTINVLSL